MRLIRRFLSLHARERALAVRAAGWLLVSRAAVTILPLSSLLRWWPRIPARPDRAALASAVECEQAVARASRVVPAATCLVQAFAGAALLRRERRPATLTIHVGLDEARQFEAHALLCSDAVVVTGRGRAMAWPVLLRADLAR